MKIALLDDYQGVALSSADWSAVHAKAAVTVFRDTIVDPDALVARLCDFEVVCIMRERTPFPRALLERLPKLKLLVTTGHRNASVDVAAAKELGIAVSGTPSSAHAAAELTWALIMAAARRLDMENRSFRAGGWQAGLGRDLNGATLGVVGLGRLGSLVAGYGRAFGMRVVAWSQNLTPARAAECGAEAVEKDTLFGQADFITLHLKLSERSRGLVGARELALMKPDAWLVNTSRGPIVDRSALLAALEAERIGGAALDVFDEEPLPADDPLRRLDNVVGTPHIGYVSRENYRTMYRVTADNVLSFLDGRPQNLIEP
ncbi:D-2-hydroxyacid dehydrogenase family protein [Pelagibius sp. CAU 1746]|uniref:D-2-hydroxyacid dehydrogenase family protein n=1 Tax=Pelagibius sp. CAU 1746 TaxID=3140370 RepID=UPI00325B13C7